MPQSPVFFLLALLALLPSLLAQNTARRDVTRLYAQLCAGCHGRGLEGGQAPSMLDDHWARGGNDEELALSIAEGLVDTGMPAWKGLLSTEEIRAMVVLIREMRAKPLKIASSEKRPGPGQEFASQLHRFRLELVAEGLETPWSLCFLPNGDLLATEKPGRLRLITKEGLQKKPISGIPPVSTRGQGGLLDVALHPDFEHTGWLYLAFSDPAPDGKGAMTAILRARLHEGSLVDQELIFRAPYQLYRNSGVHFGCRLVFDGQGHLFFGIGERGEAPDAQDLSRPNGKIHRLFDDGRVPKDNPFVGRKDAMPSIWAFGNRNPQGLALRPNSGQLWESEHGPRGGDELNLILSGRNYGWPLVTFGMNYDGTPMVANTTLPGLEAPRLHWTPSIAVCAIKFYEGKAFPAWRGNLLVTALAQEELRRIVLEGDKVVAQELLLKGAGRVRDVVCGPDGFIYLALNQPDLIVRLVPIP